MSDTRINVIGGDAYSTVGGIQAVNRFVVQQLTAAGSLRKAYFLSDDLKTASSEGQEMHQKGLVNFYRKNRTSFVIDLISQALRHPGDLWLCTHINYALLGLFLSAWRRKRVALFIYAAELDDNFTDLKLFALRRIAYLVAISNYTKKKAIKLGVVPDRVRLMLIGVDDPCPGWQPLAGTALPPRILFVGRMDERYKGQLELLDAALLLRRRFPEMHLVFVGGGTTLDTWRNEAVSRGIAEFTEFAGRVSDERLQQEYEKATVFVMLSENEGFGLVYAEAMAHGVPCIAGDRDAAREVIAHGETGLCVPAGNSTALADAISLLLRAPVVREAMARASRQRFLQNFTASHYSDRLIATIADWSQSAK